MNVESPLMQRFMHWAEAKTGDNRFLVRYYADDEPYLLLPSGLEIPFHCFFDESRRGYQWKFSNEADSSNLPKE